MFYYSVVYYNFFRRRIRRDERFLLEPFSADNASRLGAAPGRGRFRNAMRMLTWSYRVLNGGTEARSLLLSPGWLPTSIEKRFFAVAPSIPEPGAPRVELVDEMGRWAQLGPWPSAVVMAASIGGYWVPVDYPCVYPAVFLWLLGRLADEEGAAELLYECMWHPDPESCGQLDDIYYLISVARKIGAAREAGAIEKTLMQYMRVARGGAEDDEGSASEAVAEASSRIARSVEGMARRGYAERALASLGARVPVIEPGWGGDDYRVVVVECRDVVGAW